MTESSRATAKTLPVASKLQASDMLASSCQREVRSPVATSISARPMPPCSVAVVSSREPSSDHTRYLALALWPALSSRAGPPCDETMKTPPSTAPRSL